MSVFERFIAINYFLYSDKLIPRYRGERGWFHCLKVFFGVFYLWEEDALFKVFSSMIYNEMRASDVEHQKSQAQQYYSFPPRDFIVPSVRDMKYEENVNSVDEILAVANNHFIAGILQCGVKNVDFSQDVGCIEKKIIRECENYLLTRKGVSVK